uniref:HAT C-terminal dimerisation domain-containing protein n=1 Tax=Lates calcarifer TaxID=8187 RepID=A0A4W6G454_LATCA
MEKYIRESLAAGIIRSSSFPVGAGFFFVAKKDKTLRLCIDYRSLNNIAVRNKYPLPLITSAFQPLQGATISSKLDLRNAYHLVRIREAVFQALVNDVLRDFLNHFEKYVSVIASLVTEFNQRFQYFSVIEKQIKLFSTPFLVDAEEVEESLQLELIEMQCDDSLKSQHQLLSLPDFYQSLDNAKFPLMRRHAKRMMSLFGSTYICEQTFSLLNQNKSRLRTRMTDSHLCEVLRVSTTKLSPDMKLSPAERNYDVGN